MGLWITKASAVTPVYVIYDSWNHDVVENNPLTYPIFTITQSWNIISIQDYHWNYGFGQDPIMVNGSISLYDNSSGTLIGSWAASPLFGNIYWEALPNIILNPGTYKIVDSDPASWSYSLSDYYGVGERQNWQPGLGFSAVYASATPEPSSILLISSGLVLLLLTGFIRRNCRESLMSKN